MNGTPGGAPGKQPGLDTDNDGVPDDLDPDDDNDGALDGADALAIVTEWAEFRTPDFEDMKARMRQPALDRGRGF